MRPSRLHRFFILACAVFLFSTTSFAITIGADFAAHYTVTDLGAPPGVPGSLGGLTTLLGDPTTLLVGGNANEADGALYSIGLTRDVDGHITGFSGVATTFADAAYNDGGVTYGPGGVLFVARWPVNEIGQIAAGSATTDRVDASSMAESPGGLTFVPLGFAGAGGLMGVSWPTGLFYSIDFAPDGSGTFDILGATLLTTIPGGPEGFVYIEAGNAGFSVDSMLVSDYSDNRISAYEIDSIGAPIPSTRRDFITDLTGAEGAFIDPVSGDFLFSTFGGGDRIIAVRGFAPPTPGVPEPGTALLIGVGLVGAALNRGRRPKS